MSLTQINKAGLDEIALDHVFTIGASGSSAYTFQGEGLNGTVNNPTLYLTRGKTYRFENGSGGHPIRIQSTAGASGTAYNTGVTNNAGSGTVIVEVQHDAPDVLYYQCTSHAAMNGILYITGALADGGVTNAKIANNAVTGAKIADDAITQAKIAAGNVTATELGSAVNSAISLNSAKITNATHTGDVTGSTALTIANGAVNNAKVASNAAIDGTKISPNFGSQTIVTTGPITMSGGLTNATAGNAHIVLDSGTGSASGNQLSFIDFKHNGTLKANIACTEVSSGNPNLDLNSAGVGQTKIYDQGNLKLYTYTNGVFILGNLGAGDHTSANNYENVIYAGAAMDLQFKHDSVNSVIDNYTGDLYVQNASSNESGHLYLRAKGGENSIACYNDAGVELFHDGTKIVSTSATGILFNNDTSASNALGDYEEGTWTPRIGPHTDFAVYQSGVGQYTKIGNKVTCTYAFLNKSPTSWGSTAVTAIHNLPYNIRHASNNNSAHDYGTCEMMHSISFIDHGHVYFYTNNNSSYLYGLESRSNQSWTDFLVSNFSSGFYLHGHVTYFVA